MVALKDDESSFGLQYWNEVRRLHVYDTVPMEFTSQFSNHNFHYLHNQDPRISLYPSIQEPQSPCKRT